VKGINFEGLQDAGDPIALAARYSQEGADELVFLDITATLEKRKTMAQLAGEVASVLDIPFTIGGGIQSRADAYAMLQAGADKCAINSSAIHNPTLIDELAKDFGAQFVVVAIDARIENNADWVVYASGGKIKTNRKLFDWAKEAADRGAGEILFTSMDHDGTKKGFANEALATITGSVPIPVIASGGAGALQHFSDALTIGQADAVLAASVFHYKEIGIHELKEYLKNQGIPVRI
jgi:cyclase